MIVVATQRRLRRFCDINVGSTHNLTVCAVEVLVFVLPAISDQDARQAEVPLIRLYPTDATIATLLEDHASAISRGPEEA